jgi:hypothetical protein
MHKKRAVYLLWNSSLYHLSLVICLKKWDDLCFYFLGYWDDARTYMVKAEHLASDYERTLTQFEGLPGKERMGLRL